jgi:hypothetical protein
MPPFATMTAPAVESCDILTAMVPNPDKLEMLTPLASWRFLQIAALAAGSSASEARAWAADLSAPRDASSVSVL